MLKRENYFVIQGFMVTDLHLKGNELLIYAIIYGFSQTDEQVFNGSLKYLADWTNSSKQTVINCLKALIDKGYIGKKEQTVNGVKFIYYYSKFFNEVVKKFEQGSQNFLMGYSKNLNGGSQNFLPNNIYNNITDNIKDNIEIDIGKSSKQNCKPPRHKYGAYKNVLLSDEEIDTLKSELPTSWSKYIERLSEYMASTGKLYKNHLATIRTWARKDKERNGNNGQAGGATEQNIGTTYRGGKWL